MECRTGSFSGGGPKLGIGDSIRQNRRCQGADSETRLFTALAAGIRRLRNYGQPFSAVQSIPLAGNSEPRRRNNIRSLGLPHRVPCTDSAFILADPGVGRHGDWQGRVFPDPGRSDVAATVALQAAQAAVPVGDSLSVLKTTHCGFS